MNTGCHMNWPGLAIVMAFLSFPFLSTALSTTRIECARSDDYIYLYSSVATMEVRKTLQCGKIVEITETYDNYYAARTAKGDMGYLPKTIVVLLKDQPGTGLAQAALAEREQTPYGERPIVAPVAPRIGGFALVKDKAPRVKLLKALSSATAHVGDAVELAVLDDVMVDGVVVIARGAKASGTVPKWKSKSASGTTASWRSVSRRFGLRIMSRHQCDFISKRSGVRTPVRPCN